VAGGLSGVAQKYIHFFAFHLQAIFVRSSIAKSSKYLKYLLCFAP